MFTIAELKSILIQTESAHRGLEPTDMELSIERKCRELIASIESTHTCEACLKDFPKIMINFVSGGKLCDNCCKPEVGCDDDAIGASFVRRRR